MTLIYTHDAALKHVTPPGHPERVARIEALLPALKQIDGLDWREAPQGARDDVLRCHPES
jgi:acetoin utilization deacetylase AcuC-like enzyme